MHLIRKIYYKINLCTYSIFPEMRSNISQFANDKLRATISDYCHTQCRIVLSIVQFIVLTFVVAFVVCTANGFIG